MITRSDSNMAAGRCQRCPRPSCWPPMIQSDCSFPIRFTASHVTLKVYVNHLGPCAIWPFNPMENVLLDCGQPLLHCKMYTQPLMFGSEAKTKNYKDHKTRTIFRIYTPQIKLPLPLFVNKCHFAV